MGFLDRIFGNGSKAEDTVLYAPVKGEMVDIMKVSDETFSQKILGDGIAILPSEGKVYSPCDGVIDNMFETGHAFSIISSDGAEILIHVGFDTVKLKGEFFKVHKDTQDKVKKGDLLVETDIQAVKTAGYDTTLVMIILNTDDYKGFDKKEGEVGAGEEVLRLTK